MISHGIVTRFAPSPTGQLHVGGARTALFNWAYARRHGGRMILRIEDTDRARSTADSTRRIIQDLQWLGLDWDEGPDPNAADPYAQQLGQRGPYFQSQRLDLYQKYVDQLLDIGSAYRCFKTPEQLAADRQKARSEKRNIAYDPAQSKALAPEQVAEYLAQGKPHVVRFAMPAVAIRVQDQVLGDVSVQAGQIEDFVILKSDGFPTYHLAVVVDDWLMGVTHVIRGQEHLNNAPKHAALQDALGFNRPRYAHIPLIFNPDGSKMSKRDKAKLARAQARAHGIDAQDLGAAGMTDNAAFDAFMNKKSDDLTVATAIAKKLDLMLPEIDVVDFRASGYLPQVLCNYLSLLGWSPGDGTERFDMVYLIQRFGLDRIGKANARFDRDKLFRFNGEALAQRSSQEFAAILQVHLKHYHPEFLTKLGNQLAHFAAIYQPRSRTLNEPTILGRFFVEPIQCYDAKAVKKFLVSHDGQGRKMLESLRPVLANCTDWTVTGLETAVAAYAHPASFSIRQVAQPLRIALAGSTVSPPIFDTLALIGKTASLERIDRCIEHTKLQTQTRA